ncbi:ferredoxin [Cryobacterium algoritolerans]|uniref:Ferredoxin n=1 Tax=Cryobacterium algoritolerans TaxID=1259184 RepID=A0A4R8WRL8_9MICO|nr:ferredoxin [Cryobacterium algoritolerans]
MNTSTETSNARQETALVSVSVDNRHCHLYGICEQEAPEVFALGVDGRLRYSTHPAAPEAEATRQAARLCPMQAITLAGSVT